MVSGEDQQEAGDLQRCFRGVAGAHLLRAQRTLLRDKEKSDEIRSTGDY